MRIIYLISAISLLLLTQLAVGEPGQTTLTGDDAFSRANEAYRGGDWAGAEALYEQVLGTGITSAALEYNLANACLRQNELGKAILHYERARRLSPRDREILDNLRIARSMCADEIEMPDRPLILTYVDRIQQSILPQELLRFSFVPYETGGLLFVAWILTRRGGWRKWAMRTALACLAISAVAALAGYLLLQREREQPSAVVVKDSIEAMSGPGGAASSLFTLHQGTSVRQLGKEGDWALVALPNGLSGWVQTDAVQLVAALLPRP